MIESDTVLSDFKADFDRCADMFGYFTANIEGNPKIAYIERRNDNGCEYYVAKTPYAYDAYLWDEEELYSYLNDHTYAWTFHAGKAVA